MRLNLSIIIPVYNRADFFQDLLKSFTKCKYSFEIIVVDDASKERIEQICEKYLDSLDLIYYRKKKNEGPASARNKGVSLSSADIVAFTDNDCIVYPKWPFELYRYLKNSPSNVAGVGGRVINYDKNFISKYYTYHRILDPFPYGHQILYLVTANCAYRKKSFNSVGGFDVGITFPGGEDPGLGLRLREKGYELHYYPNAIVMHRYRKGLRNFIKTFYTYGKGCRDQIEKAKIKKTRSLKGDKIIDFTSIQSTFQNE